MPPNYTSIYFVPFRLGMAGLGGDLYQHLNTELNLSFSPNSETGSLKMPYAVMTAGTTNPQEVMIGMVKSFKKDPKRRPERRVASAYQKTYITCSYINDQSAVPITANLGLSEILGGWQYADDLPKLVQMATVDQVNTALNTYIVGLRWTYLGNTGTIEGFKPPVY